MKIKCGDLVKKQNNISRERLTVLEEACNMHEEGKTYRDKIKGKGSSDSFYVLHCLAGIAMPTRNSQSHPREKQ